MALPAGEADCGVLSVETRAGPMRLRKAALLSICVWLAAPGMALAQSVDSGNEVTVNPIAGNSGVLLNPGNQ
jgi:hypothetical protein